MKTLVSKFSKFYKSISTEWLSALLAVGVLALILPRVGKVWVEESLMLWIVFFPAVLLQRLAASVGLSQEQGMIVLILLSTPLVVLYWCLLFWTVQKLLRLIAGNHLGR